MDSSSNALVGGSFAPSASQSLLATESFDLPLNDAPTTAFPSTVHGAVLPVPACSGSLCAGAAAYLAKLTVPTSAAAETAALALSVDDSPNLTLRNLGSAQATGVVISVSGFTQAKQLRHDAGRGRRVQHCADRNGAGKHHGYGGELNRADSGVACAGHGRGAASGGLLAEGTGLRRGEFGLGAVTRTITVTNLTQQSQSFASQWDIGSKTTLPYTFAEKTSDCTLAGSNFLLAPGAFATLRLG